MSPRADTPAPGTAPRPRRRRYILIVSLLVVLAIAAIAVNAYAASSYDASGRPGPVASRLASAELAQRLEPWNRRFEWRVVTLRALQLLDAGKVDAAFWLLEPYSQIVRGDPLYTHTYQHVVAIKTPLDSRKAHVQHAKEQTGGVLLEKDVQH